MFADNHTKTAFNMFLDNLEQDYNNHIYLKRAISKILPLLIKNAGFLNVISCSKCIVIINDLSKIDIDNYLFNCRHVTYKKEINKLYINVT